MLLQKGLKIHEERSQRLNSKKRIIRVWLNCRILSHSFPYHLITYGITVICLVQNSVVALLKVINFLVSLQRNPNCMLGVD